LTGENKRKNASMRKKEVVPRHVRPMVKDHIEANRSLEMYTSGGGVNLVKGQVREHASGGIKSQKGSTELENP